MEEKEEIRELLIRESLEIAKAFIVEGKTRDKDIPEKSVSMVIEILKEVNSLDHDNL